MMLPDSESDLKLAPARPLWRRLLRWLGVLLGVVLVVVLAVGGWVWSKVHGSLPILDGDMTLAGLTEPVEVLRDAAGVPTIQGSHRVDVARALGYVHAQERYFQMDLIRRQAAGELAELVGGGPKRPGSPADSLGAVSGLDRRLRTHRFRWRAQQILESMPAWERQLMEAYSEGVNAGLADLDAPPFEYLVLQSEPRAWKPEDSVLVVFAMYLDLQGRGARREASFAILHHTQPELFPFLTPNGGPWDAPLVGEPMAPVPFPSAEVLNLRLRASSSGEMPPEAPDAEDAAPEAPTTEEMNVLLPEMVPGKPYDPFDATADTLPGSNNWAVDGARSRHGGAILANDMHLGHSVPNIWFRAVLVYQDEQGEERRMAGVSLPGTPAVVAGSNGHVAWGFTNSYGDWSDLVVLEPPPEESGGSESTETDDLSNVYMTPDGPRTLERVTDTLRVKGEEDIEITILESIWGPVVNRDPEGRHLAQRWTAHLPEAIDLGLVEMEGAKDIDEAMAIAQRSGVPAQNFVVVDRQGRIGWTLIGPVPRRVGLDGVLPTSWADGSRGWDGLLEPTEIPAVVDPPLGRLWTANARTTEGEDLAKLGNGGYARGARAGQIRDGLLALEQLSEQDLLDIQLDDRALFLQRWYELLKEVLATSDAPRHRELLAALDDWSGRATPESVAYRVVRNFRDTLREQTFEFLTAPSKAARDDFDFRHIRGEEGPLWQLVTLQPMHLLNPEHASWNDQMLAAADAVLEQANEQGGLTSYRWGNQSELAVRHPLSRFVPPFLGQHLDMPTTQVPGDRDMPRVQAASFGASERLVVSPGREDEGFFHMPTGQSGHPRSPYYKEGFWDWANGAPSPFLPGETAYRLTLRPGSPN